MQMMHCQDMTQIITGMMDIQEKMLMGVKPEEKRQDDAGHETNEGKDTGDEGHVQMLMGGMMGGMMGQRPPATAPEAAPAARPRAGARRTA